MLPSSVSLVLLQFFLPLQAVTSFCTVRHDKGRISVYLGLSDWSGFQAIEDDEDDILGFSVDKTSYAVEDDSQEAKAFVGDGIDAPKIEGDAAPIQVPAELGTLFGYSAENRGVGITGGVDYIDLDGPSVIIRLKGRFWHQRKTVLDRVANYLQQRIPEIIDVQVEDPYQLTDKANEEW